MRPHSLPAASLAAVLTVVPCFAQKKGDYLPDIKPASTEAKNALRVFRTPADIAVQLFAAEPMLANPVAFCLDEKGRIYVTETFRLHKGVTDNRSHKNWIDDELACRTVADRVAMYRKKFADELEDWTTEHERIRMLEDTDGDGRADRSTVFADGFKDLADGIGAGLLAHKGRVYYTCIPKLWLLEDEDADGTADRRKALHDGYGVHTSLLGHDLHGLRIGPDGKLYFSIGDRGFHVVTPEKTLSFPDEGAVLRCNQDGSELEVVHRGLRNPQELAFDKFGNLFTGDNNSDGGDKARWVYVVEGGHSGWHIGFQSLSDRGPWNREKLWHPHFRGQAAYIVPPITNLINGPSGLTYDPGVGLPERYRDRFFLCEFRGMSSMSGVVALRVEPKGASFELTDKEEFFWKILPTDVEFGLDGHLYVLDWTEGWDQPGKGRIYRAQTKQTQSSVSVATETSATTVQRVPSASADDLLALLRHRDQRVRQAAQFELVKRKRSQDLSATATKLGHRLARIHAIWGLGQLGRSDAAAAKSLIVLLDDHDHEIRSQVAKVLGQCRVNDAVEPLIARLEDRSSRVRFFAAVSLGQIAERHGGDKALGPLLELLRREDDRDPYLRHAAVMGLSGMSVEKLLAHVDDDSAAVRMGLVVTLRRLKNPGVARFFDDAEPTVVLEAARAVHDEPIEGGMVQLAQLLLRPTTTDENLVRRAINANFRIGTAECVDRVVRFARRGDADAAVRVVALDALQRWAKPSGRDRVVNLWRPLPAREVGTVKSAVAPHLGSLLSKGPSAVRSAAAELIAAHDQQGFVDDLAAIVASTAGAAKLRIAALEALQELHEKRANKILIASAELASKSDSSALRKAGMKLYANLAPKAAVPLLRDMVGSEIPLTEQQNAVLVLGELKEKAADDVISGWLDKLLIGKWSLPLQIDLLDAAAARKNEALDAKLKTFRQKRDERVAGDVVQAHAASLYGGDRGKGEQMFWTREDATSCKKCHSVHGWGGNAGPDLGDVGKRLTRLQLLTALVDPSREIAHGYGTYMYTLDDGEVLAGVIEKETDDQITLVDAAGDQHVVDKKRIKERSKPVSSMPPMVGLLKRRELRDLVEYLKRDKKKSE